MKLNLVINVVGLSPSMIGKHTPNLLKLSKKGGMRPLSTVTPAVTCSVQSTLLTGLLPSDHGIVANGWFFKNLSGVLFWRQPNQLVKGEKIWEKGKKIKLYRSRIGKVEITLDNLEPVLMLYPNDVEN